MENVFGAGERRDLIKRRIELLWSFRERDVNNGLRPCG
jgi:hypothetical protein